MTRPDCPPKSEPPIDASAAAGLGGRETLAVLAALAAGWIASGAVGMMTHPLRHVLTWLALALAVLADPPGQRRSPRQWALLAAGILAAAAMTASHLLAVNVLGAAALLAAAAAANDRAGRSALLPAALAVGVLGLYRLALGIGTVWTVTDRLGGLLGRIGGAITGRPLWVGATFGGLDFLVALAVFWAAWLLVGRAVGRTGRLAAAGGIILAHLAYLAVLSLAAEIKAALPPADPEKGFTLANAAHAAVPWNLPALGAALHLLVVGLIVRWAARPALLDADAPRSQPLVCCGRRVPSWALWAGGILVAVLLPVAAALSLGRCELKGRKVVAGEEGFLNWLKPKHGQYGRLSIGMYGMMPQFFAGFGADFHKSVQLSREELDSADLVLSIYPNEDWRAGVEIVSVGDPNARAADRWDPSKKTRVRKLKTAHGTVEIDKRSQVLFYSPAAGFVGTDRFRYTIRIARDPNTPPPGGRDVESTATVHVNVVEADLEPARPAPGPVAAEASAADDRFDVPRDSRRFRLCVLNNDAGPPGQLARLRQYVRDGGSLLVLGEHTVMDGNGVMQFNELVRDTDMSVRFDSATFAIGGWLHGYQTTYHPTTAGIHDDRNRFGAVIGASVDARWPSVPLLIGRWGWADPGQMGGAGKMGNHEYDPGEKLGDLVLAAEQPCGDGRVILFGDTSGFTNGISIGSHYYTSRLYGYLANRLASPQALWRQFLAIALAAGLVVLLAVRPDPRRVLAVSVVAAGSLAMCVRATHAAATVLPDGRGIGKNNLAYVDTTHMEAACAESWRPDGLAGLYLTLMRNGYLVLNLPEFTAERINRAGLVVSVAPSRPFTARERKIIYDYVYKGGTFLCTVGYDFAEPSGALLREFGYEISEQLQDPDEVRPRDPNAPRPPLPPPGPTEPQPMGHFKVPYVMSGGRQAFVRYHASWGIRCLDPRYRTLLAENFDSNPLQPDQPATGGTWTRAADGDARGILRVTRGYWQTPAVPVTKDGIYRCRFRMKSASPARWEAHFRDRAGKALASLRAATLPASEGWSRVDYTYPLPDANAAEMFLRFHAGTAPLDLDELLVQAENVIPRDIAFGRRLYLKRESATDGNTFWDTTPYDNRIGQPNHLDPRWVAIRDTPVIQVRRIGPGHNGAGGGQFVLIGDTCFAMNKNLERRDGQPIEGMRENADFWRWLLAELRGGPRWNPLATEPPDPNSPDQGKGVTP